LTPDDVFTAADHARLDELAEELFRELVEQGRTGHPLAWDNARAAILADLHAQLERDQAWRQQDGVVPARFESTFGYPDDPDTWPAVEVPLGAHGLLARFRGAIDRVDLSPDGRRAMVIDYKTGSTWGYDGLEDDPVLDGHKVQLALYARALRNGLPGGEALEEITAEYRFVSSKGGFQRKQIRADAQVDARLDEVVRRVAAGIGSGVFLPKPGPRKTGGFENCRFCDYDRVCSTTRDEAWERKDPAAHSQLIPLDRLVR
jgi:CRISPR/Cas system-associated exonuclease Cas4 (RecB family)